MDIGILNSWDSWRRPGQGKQGAADQTVGGADTFQTLLRAMAESPASSEQGSMRYNASGPDDAFAKSFSGMPIVAPVAHESDELEPRKPVRDFALCSLPTEKSSPSIDRHSAPMEARLEQSPRMESVPSDMTAEARVTAYLGNVRLDSTLSAGRNIAAMPSRPANVESVPHHPLDKVTGKPRMQSAQLSQNAVQLTPSDSGVKIAVRLGKLEASENEQLRARISSVAREFGQPLAGLSIRTSRRG